MSRQLSNTEWEMDGGEKKMPLCLTENDGRRVSSTAHSFLETSDLQDSEMKSVITHLSCKSCSSPEQNEGAILVLLMQL